MTNISLLKKVLFIFAVAGVISCDSDFTDLNSSIIEDDIHHNNVTQSIQDVVAYDLGVGAVQSNNLPVNALGIYNDNVFGRTKAHFVTQLELAAVNPTITNPPVIDTVYLYVPYYSTRTGSDNSTGESFYRLDSIYGNADVPMNLTVKENRYFLRTTDPVTTLQQKYYSDQRSQFDAANFGPALNNSGNPAQNVAFTFSNLEVQRKVAISGSNPIVVERLAPGIYAELDKTFFQGKIFSTTGRNSLVSNNLFKEYFRGLYFTVDGPQTAAMANLRFNEGKIVIKYHEDDSNNSTDDEIKTLTINLRGNTVNLFENEFSGDYSSAVAVGNANTTVGDERLYVRGGAGSMAVVRLNEAAIEALKPAGEDILINEANLSFYIDESKIPASKKDQPLRVYLYDMYNKIPLYDYFVDISTNTANSKLSKGVHGGLRDKNKKRYKIRITNHINNIINKDSVSRPLGLVVTENINLNYMLGVKEPFTAEGLNVDVVPGASIFSRTGTVLYGSSPDVPADKRLRLEIFYTKPE